LRFINSLYIALLSELKIRNYIFQSRLEKSFRNEEVIFNQNIFLMDPIDGTGNRRGFRLKFLLETISDKPGLRAPELGKILSVSEPTIERYIKELKENGLIEFRGEALRTGGYYAIIKKENVL
jgi:Fic family protein